MEPLFLAGTLHDKIWGGARLNTLFGYDIPTETTGEYWAISAHPNGTATITNGTYKNWTLDKLYAEHRELFGQDKSPVFPLLTKILDANDWLSVQVHPDDAYGLANEGELGKTECWYILHADEGAEIIYGHHATSKAQLQDYITTGNWSALLKRQPVKTGDFFYVPSGTLHAIGPGIVILETQQSSDTTYRVYDFDRVDANGQSRELHLQQALDVLSIGDTPHTPQQTVAHTNHTVTTLVSNTFFTVEKWVISGQATIEKQHNYQLVSVIDGNGELRVDGITYPISKGAHFILPTPVTNWSYNGELALIVSYI